MVFFGGWGGRTGKYPIRITKMQKNNILVNKRSKADIICLRSLRPYIVKVMPRSSKGFASIREWPLTEKAEYMKGNQPVLKLVTIK